MSMSIVKYTNEMFGKLKVILIENEPWFIGKDIAKTLGYKDTDQSLRKHVEDEDKQNIDPVVLTGSKIKGKGGIRRDMVIINESGLYSLILSSKLKTAKEFKRWVTKEVLPSIRKYGSYGDGQHPVIRYMNIETRKNFATVIAQLVRYARNQGFTGPDSEIYADITNIINTAANIAKGERPKAYDMNLIICSFIEHIISVNIAYMMSKSYKYEQIINFSTRNIETIVNYIKFQVAEASDDMFTIDIGVDLAEGTDITQEVELKAAANKVISNIVDDKISITFVE